MLKVGLTGGIGAGKSTVARRLAELGAVVVDADVLAREVVEPGTEGLAAVVEAFGDGVLTPDGSLDRAALAARAFAADADRVRLEQILHPRIARRTAELLAAAAADAVVVHDVPLLVEKSMGTSYHIVLVVDAPEALRVERLVRLRGMSQDDAWRRVGAQATDEQRRAAADVLVDNTGDTARVRRAVDSLWTERILRFEANVRSHRPAPRPDTVSVVPADPTWQAQAARLLGRIGAAVGPAAVRLDHIGSTAVPGLAAKNVVDLQVVVADLGAADAVRPLLEAAGFARMPGRWWDDNPEGTTTAKRLHTACDPGRAVNLHVRAHGATAWRQALLFRDWLRAQPAEAAAYAAVKTSVAGVDVPTYVRGKQPWVSQGLRRADGWARQTAHPLLA